MNTVSICFVCLGNICRSPIAESVMRYLVKEANLAKQIFVDSASIGDWHIGKAPDERAQRAASQRGYDLSILRSRQISLVDFENFDLVITMDYANIAALHRICPSTLRYKIRLLMEFDTQTVKREICDPYFRGTDSFDTVLNQCEVGCAGLLKNLFTIL